MRCHWKVKAWITDFSNREQATEWSTPAMWTMGMLKSADPAAPAVWRGKWIRSHDENLDLASWLRKSFDLPAAPSRAIVTVNVAGYVELYVNGQKVGDDVLTPAISDNTKQVFYNTYDVTALLKEGRNTIGLWLGRGWATRMDTAVSRVTPAVPHVRVQIAADIAGKPWVLGTDATWKSHASSYQRRGGMHWGDFGGERLDARADIPNWSSAEYDDKDWKSAVETEAPKGEAVAQQAPRNRIGKEIPAVAVKELGGGRVEIDFGTALTGWMRLKMPLLKPDAVVRMTFADKKMPDGTYQHFNQVSEFISAGKPGEVFQHKFNYAGFRYVLVEGLPATPVKENAVALLVESDLEPVGAFECSNDLFNRISRMNQWTQRSLNLGGYYVDCPHRERLGYGDGQVAAEGFLTSFNAYGFYRKWLTDWRNRQAPDGSMPHVAPVSRGGGGPGWPGLLSAITWRHYLYYGDVRVLAENYDAIRRYVDNLESRSKDGVLRAYGGQWDFIGDWVPPERGMDTTNWPSRAAAELFNNCYRIQQLEILKSVATVLGKGDEAARCDARIAAARAAVHAAYFDKTAGRYVIDEQAYYVMPLMTGVAPGPERAALLQKLEQNILVKNKGHLDTGMLGTYFMMEYLRGIGRNDLVFTMFNQTTYPGWGYMLAQGATTMWEQWNGHWSHLHSCFTSPDNWFYQGLAGIQPDPAAPGFKGIIIKPAVVGDLTWVKSHHDSPYGRIVSNWTRDGEKITMDVSVPANTAATVYVPAKDAADVAESGKPAGKAEGVKFLRMEENAAVYAIGSGNYQFQSRL